MFINLRRIVSVSHLILVFVMFWIVIYFYMSTWRNDLFQRLQSQSVLTDKVLRGNFAAFIDDVNNASNIFMIEREMRIREFRKMFNLTNPGEMGEPVELPEALPSYVKKQIDKGWEDYTINEFVSDLVPLQRSLPSIDSDYCKAQVYKNLPKASVIIIFHNEAWSMIFRTMHSVLDRSPDELLEEIIFVDDCSDRGELWNHLLHQRHLNA